MVVRQAPSKRSLGKNSTQTWRPAVFQSPARDLRALADRDSTLLRNGSPDEIIYWESHLDKIPEMRSSRGLQEEQTAQTAQAGEVPVPQVRRRRQKEEEALQAGEDPRLTPTGHSVPREVERLSGARSSEEQPAFGTFLSLRGGPRGATGRTGVQGLVGLGWLLRGIDRLNQLAAVVWIEPIFEGAVRRLHVARA